MFRDTKEELKRLETQLLAEEPENINEETPAEETEELTEEELAQIRRLIREPEPQYEIRNYANNYQAYNSDNTDVDPEEYTQALEEPTLSRKKILLAVLAFLALAGVVAVVVLWLARAGGIL